MAVDYKVTGDSIVSITVEVSTIGEASTIVFKKVGTARPKSVAKTPIDDNPADGRIETTTVLKKKDLIDASLDVDTIVELGEVVDPSLWDTAFENLQISYVMEGGADGKKVFKIKDAKKLRSQSRKIVSVELVVNIIF